jgi:hypothetical protein
MDDDTEGHWMTYAELGRARGISKESALKLSLRRKWRKQEDNQGHVRVHVPIDWATPRDMRVDMGVDTRAEARADMSRALGVLETAIAALGDRATAADARADRAEARADRAEAEVRALRQAELDRGARGWLDRVRAVWRSAAR